jgi:dihydrofolate reductase
MSRIYAQSTISLDGFTTGPDDGPDEPMGVGGLELHRWMMSPENTPLDKEVGRAMLADAGAFIIGRRMADIGIPLWGEDGAFEKPCFIPTNRPAPTLVKGPTTFTYITGGFEAAIVAALAAANGKATCIAGGVEVIRQALTLGILDELRLTIAPILLGGGRPLFRDLDFGGTLVPVRVVESPLATHLTDKISY